METCEAALAWMDVVAIGVFGLVFIALPTFIIVWGFRAKRLAGYHRWAPPQPYYQPGTTTVPLPRR